MRWLLLVATLLYSHAPESAELMVPSAEFDPAADQPVYLITTEATPALRLDIMTPDGDLVRTLEALELSDGAGDMAAGPRRPNR